MTINRFVEIEKAGPGIFVSMDKVIGGRVMFRQTQDAVGVKISEVTFLFATYSANNSSFTFASASGCAGKPLCMIFSTVGTVEASVEPLNIAQSRHQHRVK